MLLTNGRNGRTLSSLTVALATSIVVAGCVLAPRGLDDEQKHLDDAGSAYAEPYERRELPPLPATPTWRELLQRAFLANGEIEVAWQEWRAAVARVTRESTWPMPKLELGLEQMFSAEDMTAWDRTSVMVGFDAMDPMELPSKARTRGAMALEEARAAGERFRAAKFALQRRFLETWIALASQEEEVKLAEQSVSLLTLSAGAAARESTAGGDGRESLRARTELARAEDALRRTQSMRDRTRVELRALIGGPDPVTIVVPPGPVMRRELPIDDARVFAVAAESSPKLSELARMTAGRADALELARAAWWPDIKPSAGFTGSLSQFVGLSLTLPTTAPAIRAAIEEARADLARSSAMARQTDTDVRAMLTGELLALREAERASAFLDSTLLPLFEQLSTSTRAAYTGGRAPQREWLEVLGMELEARMAAVESRAARETSLARIEEWLGVDLETLNERPASKDGTASKDDATSKNDTEVAGG